MYSFSLRDRVWPRTILASAAQEKKAITATTIHQAGAEHRHKRESEDQVGEREHHVRAPRKHPVDDHPP